ncbi:hypothetical protein AB205_0041810 [Aquarana catesbeiana]|uniref:Uncharacterized protein n=2 Tax=Aquarana catesbeiana TaxID=8400 RepID=A0A2G9QEL9_AQUCT|nr:hypothetical protein AB205_0041810 [Aquarana catesbeiana]
MERNMAETQQVRNSSNVKESPGPETSRSRRRFKASNTAFVEMVETVDILKRADYDGKYGPYLNPNKFRTLLSPEEGEQKTPQPQDVEGGEMDDVVKIVTTTGDVHVVEEQAPHFTSASAQILIQEIVVCSRDLDIIKQKTNEVEQKLKNMIDVLGRI